MIEFMDSIVEGVDQFIEGLAEYAISIIVLLGMAIIFITTPVWILPYKLIREKLKEKENYRRIGEHMAAGFTEGLTGTYEQLKKLNERQGKEDAGNND